MDELYLQISEQIHDLRDAHLKQRLLEAPLKNSRDIVMTAKRLLAAKRYSSNTSTISVIATSIISAFQRNAQIGQVISEMYRGQLCGCGSGCGRGVTNTLTRRQGNMLPV